MNAKNPYEKLGIQEDASFEEIQSARNRLCESVEADGTAVESIEAAYDAILMERLRQRQEGQLQVPEGIRFPERTVPDEPTPTSQPAQAPGWLQDLFDSPSRSELAIAGGIYLTLAVLTLANLGSGSAAIPAESWILTTGFVVAAYWLNRKDRRFWRSLLAASLGLFGGFALGVLLAPVAANGIQAEYFASFVTLFCLWAVASFSR